MGSFSSHICTLNNQGFFFHCSNLPFCVANFLFLHPIIQTTRALERKVTESCWKKGTVAYKKPFCSTNHRPTMKDLVFEDVPTFFFKTRKNDWNWWLLLKFPLFPTQICRETRHFFRDFLVSIPQQRTGFPVNIGHPLQVIALYRFEGPHSELYLDVPGS